MSLKPSPIPPVPEETARVARAAFPKGNCYLQMRDEVGLIYEDPLFAPLYPTRGQPATAPWRLALICTLQFISPYDAEARYAIKRNTAWSGYKVHVTESCDADAPHLITHVETTQAHIQDADTAAPIQDALIQKGLPPAEHLLDAGYVDAEFLVTSQTDCRACALRSRCTKAKTEPRHLTLRPQAEHEALQAARADQKTPTWQARYAKRAGIEGTLSQGTRTFELRETRYVGLAKTHLQHVLTAAAINLVCLTDWLQDPHRSTTRPSRFGALAPAAI